MGPLDWVARALIVDHVSRVNFRLFSYPVLMNVLRFVASYDSMTILCARVEVSQVPFAYPQVLVYLSISEPTCVPLEHVFRGT